MHPRKISNATVLAERHDPGHDGWRYRGPAMGCLSWSLGVGLLISALVASWTPSWAEDGVELRERAIGKLEPTGSYVLEWRGEPAEEVEIQHAPRAVRFLLRGAPLDENLLLDVPKGLVFRVEAGVWSPDGGILSPEQMGNAVGEVVMRGTEVVFDANGLEGRLRQRDPLIGLCSAADLTKTHPELRARSPLGEHERGFLPRPGKTLAGQTVRLYLGTWNRASQLLLPEILAVGEELAARSIELELYGLPDPPEEDPAYREARLEGLPTAIVLDAAGQELGRITGLDWKEPARALGRLLDPNGQEGSR